MLYLLKPVFIILYFLFPLCLFSQTVGTIKYEQGSIEKLVLLNPVNSTECYLIDNCGRIVNKWSSDYRPGLAAMLDKQGNLYRAGRINSNVFRAGGLGGVIEKYRWDGTKEWTYTLANDSLHLHHDFYLRDNGRLIVVAWELISNESLTELGRINLNADVSFYSEIIFEIDPMDNFRMVWSWRAMDHLVQDINAGLPNYGLVHEHPEKLNLNLNQLQGLSYLDWLHINSIDYHEELGLIILSCNAIDELIVIDREISIDEAAESQGGRFNRGGDILYRLGNPGNYDSRDDRVQILFAQHDARWFQSTDSEIAFSVFNNGRRVGSENFSSVDVFEPGIELDDLKRDMYELEPGLVRPSWSYNEEGMDSLYSKRMSSARFLDGRWIVCSSDNGRLFELDQENHIYWEYINPVGPNRVFEQGEQAFGNTIFSGPVYSQDYFLDGVDVSASDEKIELNAMEGCDDKLSSLDRVSFPNAEIIISNRKLSFRAFGKFELTIYALDGRKVLSSGKFENDFCSSINGLRSGIYILDVREYERNSHLQKRIFLTH